MQPKKKEIHECCYRLEMAEYRVLPSWENRGTSSGSPREQKGGGILLRTTDSCCPLCKSGLRCQKQTCFKQDCTRQPKKKKGGEEQKSYSYIHTHTHTHNKKNVSKTNQKRVFSHIPLSRSLAISLAAASSKYFTMAW